MLLGSPRLGSTCFVGWFKFQRGLGADSDMRILRRRKFVVIAALLCAIGAVLIWMRLFGPPSEPVWKGYRLSEWLIAYDAHRFPHIGIDNPTGNRLIQKVTQRDIDEALDGIGEAALPSLRYWLTAEPGRITRFLNRVLDHGDWTSFRFPDEMYYRDLALNGFEAYGQMAQSLLPDLLKLTRSPDLDTRLWAFQAAFMTEPDKDVFMELYDRTEEQTNRSIQLLAVRWLVGRFPDVAMAKGVSNAFELPSIPPMSPPPFTGKTN